MAASRTLNKSVSGALFGIDKAPPAVTVAKPVMGRPQQESSTGRHGAAWTEVAPYSRTGDDRRSQVVVNMVGSHNIKENDKAALRQAKEQK